MARKTVGIVFFSDDDDVDAIINDLKRQYSIEILHVESSYTDRLWIKKGDAP